MASTTTTMRTNTNRARTKSAGKPTVLRKRDSNRQTQLTGVVRAVASPAVLAPVRTVAQQSDVIILSSDDDDMPFTLPNHVTASRRVEHARDEKSEKGSAKECDSIIIKRLNAEKEHLKQSLEKYRQLYVMEKCTSAQVTKEKDELALRAKEMENNLKRKADTAFPDYSDLDESITCGICTIKMWQPATLRECGHTFCRSCLHSWFNTTYNRHVAAHPEYLTGLQVPLPYLAQQHRPDVSAYLEQIKAEWRKRVPQPVYTCPTCREVVGSPPMELFFVKEVVRKVAKLTGEDEPGDEVSNRAVGSVWDGFFPKH